MESIAAKTGHAAQTPPWHLNRHASGKPGAPYPCVTRTYGPGRMSCNGSSPFASSVTPCTLRDTPRMFRVVQR